MAHRVDVGRTNPNLAAKAGRAFTRMYEVFRYAYEQADGDERKFHYVIGLFQPGHAAATPGNKKQLNIGVIARPEINLDKLAEALLDTLEGMSPKEQERLAKIGEGVGREPKKNDR